MNCGEKFPYALLTFSKKLIAGLILIIPLSKSCPGQLSATSHTPRQRHRSPTHPPPKTRPKASPHTHTPYTHTNYTPTIHNPTTPPIPLLLRVDSDEMWQKPVGFWLMRHWNARERPRSGHRASYKQGSSLLDVCLLRARAQTKVDEVYGPYGSSPNPAKFAPSKFPQTLQYFRKSHKQ